MLGNSYHLELIDFGQNDLIIDVGANVGDLLLYLPVHVNYIGVEPSPTEFSLLSLNILPNCKIYKLNEKILVAYQLKKYHFLRLLFTNL